MVTIFFTFSGPASLEHCNPGSLRLVVRGRSEFQLCGKGAVAGGYVTVMQT